MKEGGEDQITTDGVLTKHDDAWKWEKKGV